MKFPRLRFGLRTLLVLFVLAAIPSAWLGKHWLRTRVQRPIVAKIRANGGDVYYDYQTNSPNSFNTDNTPPGWKPLRTMLGDDFFATVKVVMYGHKPLKQAIDIELEQLSELEQLLLHGQSVPEATIEKISSLKKLESLSLGDPNIRPETLRKIADCSALTHLTLHGEKITTDHLRELENFQHLTGFQWINSPLTDDGLLAICELRNLKSLDLLWSGGPGSTPPFTPKGFQGLSQLTKLQSLQLSGPADEAMAAIANLPAIESVQLWGDDLTDAGLLKMASLNNLVSLKSDSDFLTDTGLKALLNLTKLEWLRLDSTNITDTGIANLSGLSKLKSLELSSPGVTDASLPMFVVLRSLERLELRDAKLTDQGLQQLSKLTSLKRLVITLSSNLTANGVEKLRTQLPDCKFFDFQSSPGGGGSSTEIR